MVFILSSTRRYDKALLVIAGGVGGGEWLTAVVSLT